MLSFYNGCDIIVNNSDTEGSEPLGTTIYEAMACKNIVAASATGGTPEIIDDKINGFVFDPNNPEAIFKTLKWICSTISTLQQVRENARKKVHERFDIVRMAEQYNLLLSSKK